MSRPATGAKNPPFSLIGGDVVIEGNVRASADLHIDGRIDGDLSCASLVQGADSVIKGKVVAASARIGGTIDGSIVADELAIEASAHITGDISYGTISIALGADVEGRMVHKAPTNELKLVVSEG